MTFLLDANILLRMIQPLHGQHRSAVDAVAMLRTSGETPCLAPQVLYEHWVVATRPVAANGLGLSISQAEAEHQRFKALFKIYDDAPAIFAEWEKRVVKYQIAGKTAHDARLVAAMVVHGIDRLLTFNTADFQRYQEIAAFSPDDVLRGQPGTPTPPSPPKATDF